MVSSSSAHPVILSASARAAVVLTRSMAVDLYRISVVVE